MTSLQWISVICIFINLFAAFFVLFSHWRSKKADDELYRSMLRTIRLQEEAIRDLSFKLDASFAREIKGLQKKEEFERGC